jgi:hypothetical protein
LAAKSDTFATLHSSKFWPNDQMGNAQAFADAVVEVDGY